MAMPAAVKCGIERQEDLLRRVVDARDAMAHDFGDGVHLEILRPGAVGQQMELAHALVDGHAVQTLAEQIDAGHAMQLDVVGTHQLFKRRVAAREQHHDLDVRYGHRREHLLQAGDAHELKALRKGEVLLYQPVARKAGGGHRQQRFVHLESDRLHGAARQAPDRTAAGARRLSVGAERLHQHAQRLAEQAFVQLPCNVIRTAQMNQQVVERNLAEVEACSGMQRNAQATADVARIGASVERQVGRVSEVLRTLHLHRPDAQGARRAEFAVGVLPHGLAGPQAAVAWQGRTGGEARIVRIDRHLNHCHRGRRRHELRVDDVEQMPGEAGVFRVELEAHARRQECRGLDQALDVRVGNFLARDAQAVRDLWEGLRELRRTLAEVTQFLLVQGQETRVHFATSGSGS